MKTKFLSLLTLLVVCVTGAWAETFTVNCEASTSDPLFPISSVPTQYAYSSNSNISGWKLIEMDKGSSITITNVTGATITAVTAEGVADNNGNQTVNFTISDGTTTAQTSSGSWNNRKSTSLTSKAFNATNVGKLLHGAGQTYTITNMSSSSYNAGVRFVITYTPASGPVDKETVATPVLPTGGIFYTDSKSISITCGTDGASIYYTLDGSTPTSSSTLYVEPLNITETTTVKAIAIKSGCNDSEVASATYTKVELLTQQSVSEARTWDWAEITSGEINLSNGPISNTDVVMANIPAYGYTLTAPATFNAQNLLVNCQYAWRNANDSKFLQGNKIQFNSTVAGTVTIEYANTGNNPKRTIVVNGTRGAKTSAANNSYQSESFKVLAGSVEMTGVQTETIEGKGNNGDAKMLRIRKVIFTPAYSIASTPSGYYSTFFDTDNKVKLPANVTAYTAEYNSENSSLTLTAFSGENADVVPANTPVILKYNSTEAFNLFVTSATAFDVSARTNSLSGSTGSATGGENIFVLGHQNDATAFYKYTSGTIPANKAYLDLSSFGTAPSAIRIVEAENNATAIEDLKADEETIKFMENGQLLIKKNGVVYDVIGRIIR